MLKLSFIRTENFNLLQPRLLLLHELVLLPPLVAPMQCLASREH